LKISAAAVGSDFFFAKLYTPCPQASTLLVALLVVVVFGCLFGRIVAFVCCFVGFNAGSWDSRSDEQKCE
jgi:hypothetical protein